MAANVKYMTSQSPNKLWHVRNANQVGECQSPNKLWHVRNANQVGELNAKRGRDLDGFVTSNVQENSVAIARCGPSKWPPTSNT